MNVADVMTSREDVVTVEIPGTRDDVLEYLQDRAFSSVPVVKQTEEGEVYRGIVSRDALIEQPDEDQLALLAEEVPTTSADTSLREVAELMVTEGARRVPVVDGELEGIVTVTDVVRAIARGDVEWTHDDRLDLTIPKTVPGTDVDALYPPDHVDDFDRRYRELRTEREVYLAGFEDLHPDIADASY
jgi:CBS domain-containing protein